MQIKQPVSIAGIEFDALIGKDESYSSDIPQYPVEEGYVVSDNITLQPLVLDMTLFLTNTPVTHRLRHLPSPLRVDEVCSMLLLMRDTRELVTIVTSDKTYEDMGLTSLTISETRAGSREITVSFTKVIKTATEKVSIPSSYGKSGSTGTSAGTVSKAASVSSSAVSSGVTTLGSMFGAA